MSKVCISVTIGLLVVSSAYWLLSRMVDNSVKYSIEESIASQTYASDSPSLNGDNDAEWVRNLRERVDKYLSSAGVSPPHAADLRFAYRPYDLLARFRLPKDDLHCFLQDKQKIANSAVGPLAGRDEFGYRADLGTEGTEYFGPLRENAEFFERLSWWPIPPEERSEFALYRGILTWDTVERHAGSAYYVLANRRTGVVYVLAG